MKSAFRIAAPLAAMFFAAPVAAIAQNAIVTDDSALRAGPGFQYPRVAYVPDDARVSIHGCLRGYSWCDVSWRGDRGWIDATNLSYAWNNRYVVVEEWGPRIGLPVIGFSVEDYWTRYYRDRPWWNQRQTWFGRDWRDGGRDRFDRNDAWRERRGEQWRDRDARHDRDEWRDPRDGRERQDRDHDGRRDQQLQRDQHDQRGGNVDRDERVNRQGGDTGTRAERNRGDNAPTGRIPEQRPQQGGRGQGGLQQDRM
ncbi:MAG: SH3 domain-containing protein [Beijerinckiaceae bacterium]|nr:SH3 domain-containing protein [Beijerinckiaceae bacterium]